MKKCNHVDTNKGRVYAVIFNKLVVNVVLLSFVVVCGARSLY